MGMEMQQRPPGFRFASDHPDLSKTDCTCFFTQRVAKYRSSRIIDRTTKDGKGYWLVYGSEESEMGIRKYLAYRLKGRNEKGKGLKTDWIMKEYVHKPADSEVKEDKTMAFCRIHRKKQKRKETDACNAREQVPDSSTKDGNREKLMKIESSQEYQKRNFVAPENKGIVFIDLCSDKDESSEGHDTLKNRIPGKHGRGEDGNGEECDDE